MNQDKLTTFDSYTFMASSHRFQSILDKIFTSFPTEHCERTVILDWDHQYTNVGLSDHRAVLTQISLRSLCEGWVEYLAIPFNFSPRIRLDRIAPDQIRRLYKSIKEWRSRLPSSISNYLLQDQDSQQTTHSKVEPDSLAQMHELLTEVFVDRPAKALNTGQHHKKQIYKTPEAGLANHVLTWLHRYKVALTFLRDAKSKGSRNLQKNERRQARWTYLDYQNETRLQDALPEINKLLPRDFSLWTEYEWSEHWNMVCSLHLKWKREYDKQLRDSKQAKQEKQQNDAFFTAIGSKARRAHQLVHKNASMSLPAVMKDPTDPKKMVIGHRVNEIWETSATATRPNTMPTTSTEPTQVPPWLNPELWSELKSKISPSKTT
jgi:hypothetical protein